MSLPSVRDRDHLEVFACDISTAKFPRKDEPEVRKIKIFQQDVTKSFPDEFLGTFDLVNVHFARVQARDPAGGNHQKYDGQER